MPKLPANIRRAILSGPIPPAVNLKRVINKPRTRGEKVVAFAARYLRCPEGMKVGQPLILEPFQVAFILAVMDNPVGTRHAILSIARRNGKTFLVAVILLAYIIGPLAEQNTTIASGAMSRDQAALCFGLMSKMLAMSPEVQGLYRVIPSQKQIFGLSRSVEYLALASDAKTGFGRSLKILLLDEAGQIEGPISDFVSMLSTSQGSYDDSLMLTISTQAPSDTDYLSLQIDNAERNQDPHTVCHVYTAEPDCDLMDEAAWKQANPGLGIFRSVKDLREQMKEALEIPTKESGVRNLLLNQRVAMEGLFLSPNVWRRNQDPPNLEIFRTSRVVAGLDLSAMHDLTAFVMAAKDDAGQVHVLPFVFCPTHGIEARARRDLAPYDLWVKQGHLIPLGGEVMDYDQVCEFMREETRRLGVRVREIHFDNWHIKDLKAAARRTNSFAGAQWNDVIQGYKSMSPRCNSLLNNMMEGKIRHGSHPLLTMAASNAIAVRDAAGNVKLDKAKSTQRIDPLVALVMAAYPLQDGAPAKPSIDGMIG